MEKKKKKWRQEKNSMIDNIDYMENFATEFSKHEVLMYPSDFVKKKLGDVQEARKHAFKQISEALSINDWRIARRQSMHFKQYCLQKMRRFVRVSLVRGRSGLEALELAPEWLKNLNPALDLLNKALKLESMDDGTMLATRKRMMNFMWDLYGAVRDEVARSNRPADALRGRDAVQYYAEKIDLPFVTLYEIWNRLLQMSLHKMIEVRSSGDRPSILHRPSQLEWRLINMALLYDLRIIVVHDDSFTNHREMDAMVQLYMLMCQAQIKFECLMRNQKNKDMPNIGCDVKSENQDDPTPSCSSEAQSDGVDEEDGLVWEVEELWKYVHAEYISRGRTASLVLLQRRWHELRQLTRRRLLDAFRVKDLHPHPLLLAIGKRFPCVVRSPLPAWRQLVADGLIFTDANLVLQKQKEYSEHSIDFPPDVSMKDVTTDLLDWSDDDLEIIESKREIIEIASDSDTEPNISGGQIDTKLLDKAISQLLKENAAKSVQESDNKTIVGQPPTIKLESASESTLQDVPDKEKNTSISDVAADIADTKLPFNNLDPTKTKVRIIFEDDSDLEELDRMNSNKTMSDEANEMDENNENLCNTNDKTEMKNKNEKNDSTIAPKTNESKTNVDCNTGIINKNVFNVDTETDKSNANSVVKSNIAANDSDGKYNTAFSKDNKMDKLSLNDAINETNKNVIDTGTETIERNRNSDFIQKTDHIVCQSRKSSLSPQKCQTSDDCKDTIIKNEDSLVETIDSGKVQEKEINPNSSSDSSLLTKRPNFSSNIDSQMVIKKTVVANFYKMIGSDILNTPSNIIAQYPENRYSLIKHKEVFRYAPDIELMSVSSDEDGSRPISKLRNVTDAAETFNDGFIIDDKLLKLFRVVITPLEDIPVWRAKSRNGTINCRAFSTKKFAAAPIITPEMLPFCRRYTRPSPFGCTYLPSLPRTSTGLNTQSSQQLAALPRDIKAIRKKLTRNLKLSKTSYTAEFWSHVRNLKQLEMCVPVTVRLERLASRLVKKVELADIDEVRRINKTILTAQVAPNNVTSIKTQVASGERKLSDVSSSLANTFVMTSPSTAPTIVPTKEELKVMIKDLVMPSIKALGTYPRQGPVETDQKTSRSALWRIDDKKLENDIRDVVKILSIKEKSQKAKSKNKCKKKPQKNHRNSITGSEQPLDAYAEWQRQKTCTHKYFNFTTPGTSKKIKKDHVVGPKLVKNEINKMTFAANVNANVETVDLMDISDDEDNSLVICEESKEDEENVLLDNAILARMDSLKRPNSENESESYKRRKISDEIADAGNSKSTENASNDCDLIVIDDDDPVRDESVSPKATQNVSTVELMASVLGLKTNRVRPSQVVYVVNTGKTTDSRSTTIVTTYTAPAVKPKSIGTQKLPSDDSTLLIPDISTSLNSNFQIPQKTISLISTFPDPENPLVLSSTKPGTQNLTSANTSSGSQTMLSINCNLSGINIPISVNSTNSSHRPIFNITHQPRKLVTHKPSLVFEQTPSLLNSTLTGTEKPALLNSILSNPNNLSLLKSKLPNFEKPQSLNSKLGSIVHNVGTVNVGSNNPITLNKETSPQPLMSLAQAVTTECTVGEYKYKFHIQDRIIHEADTNVEKPPATKPHIVIDPTVRSKDSSDEVPRTNVDNCTNIGMEELNFISISTNHTISNNKSHNQSYSGSNAKLQTIEAIPRIVCITSLADKDNLNIATNANNETKVICPESHINEINPDIHFTFTKSDGIAKSPTLFDVNDKLRSEENKVDSHASVDKQSLPVISSVSSLAPRIRVKDEFKITNFECSSSTDSCNSSLLDTQESELEHVTIKSFKIEETDVSAEKQIESSLVETKVAFGSTAVKCERIETEDENNSSIKTSVKVKIEQGGKKIKGSGKESDNNDDNEECEEFVNGGSPDTLLVGVVTRYEKWTAASEVHSNQPTGDNTSLSFRSITDLGTCAVPVSQYAADVSDPDEPLLKIDATRPWWLLSNKYVLLTDEHVHCHRVVHLSSQPVGSIAPYTVLLFPPPDGRQLTLDLGAKKGRDVVVCGCQPGRDLCPLCQSLAQREPNSPPKRTSCTQCGVTATRERTPLLRLRQRTYRKVSDRPLKYVFVEMRRECRGCRVGVQFVADPETVLINGKVYEKISSDPLMYSPVLSVVQSPQSCSALVKQEAELYLLNLRTAQHRRLLYHADDKYRDFNKAVSSLMTKLDREETDTWYRLQIEKSSAID